MQPANEFNYVPLNGLLVGPFGLIKQPAPR
jgi:hypothetical protein